MQPLVTILVPNFRTLKLTQLCLRLLRQHTDLTRARVIVIDNDSQDDSLAYLRTLKWITLIERIAIPGESACQSHARALDLGLAHVDTPYVLSIHTDTLVKHADWLPFLLSHIERDTQIAGVGSWKLEFKPRWRRSLKMIEHYMQRAYYAVIGREQHGLQGVGINFPYLRSHCALYRTSLLRQHQLHFSDGDMVAGKKLHQSLLALGYQMRFIDSEQLCDYLEHINHATVVLNPHLSTRVKSVDKGRQRIAKALARFNADIILQSEALDC